jgi:ABC-type siderophore export system fused ATPase/permease subunit
MKAIGWRFWMFAALMVADAALAAAFVHHIYGLLFLAAAFWFAICAAREAAERPKSKP